MICNSIGFYKIMTVFVTTTNKIIAVVAVSVGFCSFTRCVLNTSKIMPVLFITNDVLSYPKFDYNSATL